MLTTAIGTMAPALLLLHPDHVPGETVDAVHFLADPFHLGVAAGAVLLSAITVWYLTRPNRPSRAPARRK